MGVIAKFSISFAESPKGLFVLLKILSDTKFWRDFFKMHSIGPTTFNPLLINNNIPHTFHLENDPPVLDLCVKTKRESPSYTLSYPSPRHSPGYQDTQQPDAHFAKSPKALSECSQESPKSLDATDYVGSRNIPTIPRSFKAFASNPLMFTMNILAKIDPPRITEPLKSKEPATVMYEEFRDKMLAQVQDYKGTNMNMRRNQTQDQRIADPSYLERRKKNNEAAKKSRDARKAREDEIAIRCAFLEQENIKLKANLVSVEAEVARLKNVLFHR